MCLGRLSKKIAKALKKKKKTFNTKLGQNFKLKTWLNKLFEVVEAFWTEIMLMSRESFDFMSRQKTWMLCLACVDLT